MPSAEIVTIGTEILLGEIVDTNASHIARTLRACGVDVFRTTSVGDNVARIADALREAAARADVVITTGGLGPTVDDPTREAVARAVGVDTEFRPELWDQIRAVFARYGTPPAENNRRQAFVPCGAEAIANPVGTAPGFIAPTGRGGIVALPGVPREMEHLLAEAVVPWLRARFGLTHTIVVRVLRTAGAGESAIDARIGDLEHRVNPTVGLAAHAGQVDVRIAAKAASEADAAALIAPVEADLRARLGDWVFGADGDTLAGAVLKRLAARRQTLAVVEAGLGGRLAGALGDAASADPGSGASGPFAGGEVRPGGLDAEGLAAWTAAYRTGCGADIGLGIALETAPERVVARLCLVTPTSTEHRERSHGGHPRMAAGRAVNLGLDWVRQLAAADRAG